MSDYRADATYRNAERASAEYRDTRTGAQKRWDSHADAIEEIVARMRGITHPANARWSRDPGILEVMTDYARDITRELQALNVEGFREGDPVGGIPKLEPIATRAAQLSSPEVA